MEAVDEEKHFSSFLRFFTPIQIGSEDILKVFTDEDQFSVTIPRSVDGCSSGNTFFYDEFLKDDASPKAVYKENVKALVDSVLKGYNGTLISLGLESTDHLSFTFGSAPKGLLYEAASHILSCIKKLQRKDMSSNLTVPCSYVLIANERIYDLLQGYGEMEGGMTVPQLAAVSGKSSISISDSKVKGCRTVEAKKMKDIGNMLIHGSKAKNGILLEMADCGVYHCAFTIGIEYSKFGSMFAPISGTLMTVSLVLPDQLQVNSPFAATEGIDLKSIVALKSIIEQLSVQAHPASSTSTSSQTVPYNDSLLTRLLQAAIGGNCKTLLMTHVPRVIPSEHIAQLCYILELGSKARHIRNKPDKTELAEKALMDAYYKEMKRQARHQGESNKSTTEPDDSQQPRQTSTQSEEEDQMMIAQALASAVNDGFEDYSDESDEEEISQGGHTIRHKRISLKPRSRRPTKQLDAFRDKTNELDSRTHRAESEVLNLTIESLIVLIQDPDNGVPRASGNALTNVSIHRGKGSVFSGASIVQWLLANVDGVTTTEDAECLGQILLDRGAIFHSDGSSLFLNSENLFYYARDPLSSGKILSMEEIRALLNSSTQKKEQQPTLQVTTINKQEAKTEEIIPEEENDSSNVNETEEGSTHGNSNGMIDVKKHEDGIRSDFDHENTAPTINPEIEFLQSNLEETDETVPSESHKCESNNDIYQDSTLQSLSAQNSSAKFNGEISHKVEDNSQPDQDFQNVRIDLVTLERTTNYPHPLHFAAATHKNTGVVGNLIKWYGVDCLDEQKRTPLMFAALGNKASICRNLIDCGAVIDKQDQSGLTALHVACYHGSKDALSVLLSKKANMLMTDRMYHTAYHWGVVPSSPACLKQLLRHTKISIKFENMTDKNGSSPLHWAIFYNHHDHLNLLIKRIENPLKLDSKGRTLMTYAIRENADRCVQTLCAAFKILAFEPDNHGLTPLHHASIEESPFYLACLVNTLKENLSSCIEVKDSEGRTPLHYALIYQRYKNIQILLQFGANRSSEDNSGRNPLELARCYYSEVDETIVKLMQNEQESEPAAVDLNQILTNSRSQHQSKGNNDESKSQVCVIL